ncbi:hypothetical protein UA08_00021 [Talaromyces atroroseus]|uniref:Uncharacterized protein n=1 Tax=Talaromyces atroroseus TaxID=1441469 RepID=A0A225BE94_TALAT|nr:hypothetical protein UA08_00021 [Talaromyces atroroseus]OKL64337.1 hypothetical protein UA08_00021 [Talaromyces atroroseus]
MGHALSKEVRHEPQNPRRLSKPQISQPKVGKATKTANCDPSPLLDESMFWKSPWTGDLLPKVTPDSTDRNRVRSFPSLSEPPLLTQGSKRWSSLDDFVLMKNDGSLSRSSSYISRRLSRRSSHTRRSEQPGKLTLRDTRREPVIHFGPSDIGNHDQRSSIENLTAEDRSPVEDSCVPLGRRQSFRRPGIATRTPSWGLYRTQLPSIQQEDEKEHHDVTSASQLSPCETEEQGEYMPVYSSNRRATSPVALDYSHLSGFKKGTLRIVNGSVSPACSDRVRLLTTSTLAQEPVKPVYDKETPTVFTSSMDYDDEAIDVFDNNLYNENHNSSRNRQPLEACEGIASEVIDFTRIEKTQSITNVDSGYSSLSSLRSDDSSRQSSSPPMGSPMDGSPAQSGGGSPMDKEGFYNQNNPEDESYFTINKSSIDRENCNLGYPEAHRAGDPNAERSRYYAHLGHLSVPSVPGVVGIEDRESDLEDSYIGTDDSESVYNDQSDRFPVPRSKPDYVDQAVTSETGSGPLAYGEDCDAPRGRTRSRSISHSPSKLAKTTASHYRS